MSASIKELLLCTDLDRTLIPNGKQPESEHARPLFTKLTSLPEVTLVYVTGRHKELIEQAIEEYQLPQPDYVISDVGSTLYRVSDRYWQLVQQWSDKLAGDWHGISRDDIVKMLLRFKQLHLQEPAKQSRFKLSYYVSMDDSIEKLADEINTCIKEQGVAANLIWSIDETDFTGLLDILPRSASKLHAIEFLITTLNLSYEDVVFAGDSGNDISVLASAIPSVLVSNATDDVCKAVLLKAKHDNQSDKLYLAKGEYLSMNGNYSGGILEGVAHYRPDVDQWLHNQ